MSERRAVTASEAEARSAKWLGDGNQYLERGDSVRAERCFAKAQYWLDLANRRRGFGDGRH